MSAENPKGIWIITDETPVSEAASGGKTGVDIGPYYGYAEEISEPRVEKKRTRVKADDLKQEMNEFIEIIQEIFDRADFPKSKMQLEEIELSVEINGEGQVSLLGTGGKAGVKGAIHLKFKRNSF